MQLLGYSYEAETVITIIINEDTKTYNPDAHSCQPPHSLRGNR